MMLSASVTTFSMFRTRLSSKLKLKLPRTLPRGTMSLVAWTGTDGGGGGG